jgi:MFS family permease
MNIGIALLALAYILSQFFRAFLAVLSPFLASDLGAGPEDLALASGMWFLTFAAMQLPIGWALDTVGPRRTAASLLMVGGAGGAALFALATTPAHVAIAMALIGVGCAPVLMASYYIFALDHPPPRFAFLAALMVGVGTLGNIVASYPTTLAAETMGWRAALAEGDLLVDFGARLAELLLGVAHAPCGQGHRQHENRTLGVISSNFHDVVSSLMVSSK